VRAHADTSRHHARARRPREPGIEKAHVAERGRVGVQLEVEAQRVAGPRHHAPHRAQRGRGEAQPREIEVQRVADDAHPPRRIGDAHGGIAALHGESRHVEPDAALVRRGDLEGGEPRVEVFEPPDAHPPVRAAARDLEERVARRGARRLEPQRHGAVLDPHVPEHDERGGAVRPRVGPAQAQQLLHVQPPVAVLHHVDHGPLEREFEQRHAAGGEVQRVVARLHPWQPGDERAVGVEQPHLVEGDPGEHRTADAAHLDRAREDRGEGPLGDPGEQGAAGGGAAERGERAQEAGEQSRHRPQRDAEGAADHVRRPAPRRTGSPAAARSRAAGPAGTRRRGSG
jgi:hypothetical protein